MQAIADFVKQSLTDANVKVPETALADLSAKLASEMAQEATAEATQEASQEASQEATAETMSEIARPGGFRF
jgi:hypothetical protein